MRSRSTWAAVTAAVLLTAGLTGCASDGGDKGPEGTSPAAQQSPSPSPTSKAQISSSVPAGAADVAINRTLRLDVAEGTFDSVTVTGSVGTLAGTLAADKLSWQSTGRLQPGALYKVSGTAVDADGLQTTYSARFRTEKLPLNRLTYPSFVPLPGQTVGVGMPVIIKFDVPVTDRKSIQRHLHVKSTPVQAGGFRWISNQEVHWRPAKYWKPGTKVVVNADIGSVPAGNGVYGQKSRTSSFTVGRSMVSKVDMNTHQMKVFRNGKLIRTIPITTGEQPKFTTRSGTKVIIEKFRRKRMNSETVGIPVDSSDGYDLDNVEFAMRLTYSGEFVHAAPWSVGSQGRANVSHGCTGMSTGNAGWLYGQTIIGDVIEYTGTTKPMTLGNGYGDWNLPFIQYAQQV